MARILMKGNEAIAAAAIKAGCKYFFGYPITPQNEIPEYLSRELPKNGGVFLQSESEIAAINMIYGASGAGARVMTSSASVGIALMQEGISYIAASELPCVIVNVSRSGPGLGGILPAQSDYFMATRGGGNGDYRVLVYAPSDIQEMTELVQEAFEVADYYRNPVMILTDGMMGQMMESIEISEVPKTRKLEGKSWATTGTGLIRKPNVINSLVLDPAMLEIKNIELHDKYEKMVLNEARYEVYNFDSPEIVVVAYGTTSRIVKSAISTLSEKGIRVGLIRPITLWPYPNSAFDAIPESCKGILCVEMSMGQMIDDVKIASNGRWSVDFYGRCGGMVPTEEDIILKIEGMMR
jgi:2-oxoglutarate/2-oxoacid ferredoxin oxidoreductase subunit alpha